MKGRFLSLVSGSLLVACASLVADAKEIKSPTEKSRPEKSSQVNSKNSQKEEVLNFPESSSLGQLFKITIDGDDLRMDKHHFADAKGAVKIPAGSYVLLRLSYDGVANAASMAGVNPRAMVSIDARSLDNLNDDTLSYVAHFSNLRHLLLDESDVSDKGLKRLSPLKELTQLSLKSTLVSGAAFGTFSNFPNLTQLHLSCNQLGRTTLAPLGLLTRLKRLDLESVGINDSVLGTLPGLPQLYYLNIARNQKVSDKGIACLKKFTSLRQLDVGWTAVTARGLEQLKGLPLEQVYFDLKSHSADDLAHLEKTFPKCKFEEARTGGRDPSFFAPLK